MTKVTNQLVRSPEFDHVTASATAPRSCKQPEKYVVGPRGRGIACNEHRLFQPALGTSQSVLRTQ